MRAHSIFILRSAIALPGWGKTIQDLYLGGKLLADTIPDPGELGSFDKNAELEFEMSQAGRDLCKSAIQSALDQKALPASPYASEIIEKLELVSLPKL